ARPQGPTGQGTDRGEPASHARGDAAGEAPGASRDDHRRPKKSFDVARDTAEEPRRRRERLVNAVLEQRGRLPVKPLCEALGVSRATVERRRRPPTRRTSRPRSARKLANEEK